MNEEQERRAQLIVERQLDLAIDTLAAMRTAGLTADSVVVLEFSFVAPSRICAESLRHHLEDNDCTDVEVLKSPGLFSRRYFVTGKSLPTKVDTDVLSQWIPWMVVQGVLHDCEFDGFGTEVG